MSDDPRPYSSPDVMQNVRDLYAEMQRDRAERGPRLREMRGTAAVIANLAERLPQAPERKPWEPLPLLAVPVIEDEEVLAGTLCLVYDDGSTRTMIVDADQYLAGLAAEWLSEPVEFTPPPTPAPFSAYYRSSAFYAPITRPLPPTWGAGA